MLHRARVQRPGITDCPTSCLHNLFLHNLLLRLVLIETRFKTRFGQQHLACFGIPIHQRMKKICMSKFNLPHKFVYKYILKYMYHFYKSFRTSRQIRRTLRTDSDPFALDEIEFRKLFRLSRSCVEALLLKFRDGNPALFEGRLSTAIPFELRFLATLNFFANGSYQKPTAEGRLVCQAQSSMSNSLHIVLNELLKLAPKYIRFPRTPEEVRASKLKFSAKFRMSGILGAVDGTHVAIIQPPANMNGHLYYNRKHFYSINVLAACNADMEFVYANAQYPGSTHDAAIWQMATLQDMIVDDSGTFLLGNIRSSRSDIVFRDAVPQPVCMPSAFIKRALCLICAFHN